MKSSTADYVLSHLTVNSSALLSYSVAAILLNPTSDRAQAICSLLPFTRNMQFGDMSATYLFYRWPQTCFFNVQERSSLTTRSVSSSGNCRIKEVSLAHSQACSCSYLHARSIMSQRARSSMQLGSSRWFIGLLILGLLQQHLSAGDFTRAGRPDSFILVYIYKEESCLQPSIVLSQDYSSFLVITFQVPQNYSLSSLSIVQNTRLLKAGLIYSTKRISYLRCILSWLVGLGYTQAVMSVISTGLDISTYAVRVELRNETTCITSQLRGESSACQWWVRGSVCRLSWI